MTVYACGLRISEAKNLKTSDFDRPRMQLRVRKGKGAKERVLPIGRHRLQGDLGITAVLYLMRHPDCRPLKHCRWCYGWTGLDHPKFLAAGVDEDVKAWTQRKCERARTVCVNRVDS